MGYRSDGKLWFSEEAEKFLTSEIKNALTEYETTTINESTIYSFEGWKWYSSYPEIKLIEDFMYKLDAEDIPYEFIRLGESDDDVEHRGEWDLFYVHRSIEVYS